MRSRLVVALGVMVLAGCGGTLTVEQVETPTPFIARASPTSTPTVHAPTPTPEPTPAPTPTEEELAAACLGKPVPWAARYAGKIHPLVVAGKRGDSDRFPDIYAINQKWYDEVWTNAMIQLVVCPEYSGLTVEDVGSCGTYEICPGCRPRGKLIRQRVKETIRVVVAKTGKTLQSKTLSGPVDDCPTSYGVPLGDDPPWYMPTNVVSDAQISEYATAVSKQPVK